MNQLTYLAHAGHVHVEQTASTVSPLFLLAGIGFILAVVAVYVVAERRAATARQRTDK